MSTTLTLGAVTLQLPLNVKRTSLAPFVVDADDIMICRVDYADSTTTTEDAAIAALFAASPDLLVAAEALMDIHSLGVLAFEDKAIADATDRLIHAIARARGQEQG
jgi:hypothetical protein